MEDFGKYLEESMSGIVTGFKQGQRVSATVCSIDSKTVFIDVNSTSEGLINREEFLNDDGSLSINVGDTVEAFYVDNSDGSPHFSVKMSGKVLNGQLEEAFAANIPVEGKVIAERKGGYSVKLGNSEAFCPYSQMSLSGGTPESFIGNTFLFHIQELDGRNFIVTRRKILEQQRAEKLADYKENMQVGELLRGRVSSVKDFGVFVDLDGVQGFIPVSELSWGRVKPEDIVREGDEVSVSVIALDWERNRITLSFRSANSPWENIAAKYQTGSTHTATVSRIEPFGAFVELEPGVDGLIHISKLGKGKRINSPSEVVSIGDSIEVVIDSIDPESHRIALVPDYYAASRASKPQAEPAAAGTTVTGTVESLKPFGAFIRLPDGKSGLLHISESGIDGQKGNSYKSLEAKFPVGSQQEVIIKSAENGKISLTTPAARERAADNSPGSFSDRRAADIGNIGNLFDGL